MERKITVIKIDICSYTNFDKTTSYRIVAQYVYLDGTERYFCKSFINYPTPMEVAEFFFDLSDNIRRVELYAEESRKEVESLAADFKGSGG
jgi:hypothetical protein